MINDCRHEFLFALAVSNLIRIRLASVLALHSIRVSVPEMFNDARHRSGHRNWLNDIRLTVVHSS